MSSSLDRLRNRASSDYTNGLLGDRRPLTWIRTPLHEREYELTRLRRNSDPDLQTATTFSQRSKRRSSAPNSPLANYIRNFTWRVLRAGHKSHQNCQENGGLGNAKKLLEKPSTGKRKNAKQWNMLRFVVGGQQFQCPEWIFQGHPLTLLGNLDKRKIYFHTKRKTFIFPQILPDVFTAVLEYYQTGWLTRPERLTLDYFLQQLEIFDLEAESIDVLLKFEGVHMIKSPVLEEDCKWMIRSQLWNVLEHPRSSPLARLYCNLSLFLTVLSVVLYVLETLPELKSYSLMGQTCLSDVLRSPLVIINFVCFLFFCTEFILRLVSCPSKVHFMRTWTNWTDLISILPYIIIILLLVLHHYDKERIMPISLLNTLRACRLFLVTRVLGTSRYYRQHWIVILVQTLWNNVATLAVLFFLMIICMVGFGGAIYALEGVGQEHPSVSTIPLGMWWAVVTMTTVGYGDVVPKRAAGQVVAILCGCVGLMFMGFVLESVTYEYHRLMKTNSQYLRYKSQISARKTAKPTTDTTTSNMKRITSCHVSMMNMADELNEVVVSINGAEFLLALTDLNRHPNSLLGHPSKRAQYFNPTTGSYFFPRNQDIFPSIHHYYQWPGSVLQRPPFITVQRFVEEIEFFQLRPQAVIEFFASEGIRLVDEKQPKNPRLRYWYLVLEHPQYNLLANLISVLSMLATACFTVMVILESLPSILDPSCSTALSANENNWTLSGSRRNVTFSQRTINEDFCSPELAFFIIETICTGWFILELVGRFSVAPSKGEFLKRPMNWVDGLVIAPYVCTVIQLMAVASASEHVNISRLFGFFRTMRLFRLVSILKFGRYFKRLQMIFAILQSTWSELLMLCYFMLINSIIFGTMVYVIEADVEGNFNSIPRGMYWAWITMLTIGYGDLIPVTPGGKVVGAGCAILGIVFWTLPMTLISDHFANYRRLYEGQEYLMECLTRMYHLLDSETKRGIMKTASSVPEPELLHLHVANEVLDGKASGNVSPHEPLLSRGSRQSSTRINRNQSSRSVSPGDAQISEDSQTRFPRLEYNNGLSSSKYKTSSVTIGIGQTESPLDLVA